MWQKSKFEVDRIKAGESAKVGLLVEVKAPELAVTVTARNPQAIVFVVDRSGSMGDGRLDLVKDSIGELVGRLAPTDYMAIVSFDTELEIHVPMQPVGATSAQKIRRDLAGLEPRGGTNIEMGYLAGLTEASKAPGDMERLVVLLSDGQANDGVQDPAQLGQLAAFATEHLVKTSTIGIGKGFDERILSSIAGAGHGNHFAAVVLQEALAGLQDEIDGLLQRSLSDLTCMVEIVDKSKKVWVHPLGYIKSKKGHLGGLTVQLSDMAAGEERGFAFVVDVDSISDPGDIEFKVLVSGSEVSTGQKVEQVSYLKLNIASPVGFVQPARDEDVVAEILAYRLTDVKAMAAAAAYRGDFSEARRLIREAQGDTQHLIQNIKSLSPRLRARLLAEHAELGQLLDANQDVLSKRATESSFRSARSKQDPRNK
jgi:Ca-activated chloride channel family protein